jgi:TonB family protein
LTFLSRTVVLAMLLLACGAVRAQGSQPDAAQPGAGATAPRVPADPLTPDVQFWRERIRQQIQQRLALPGEMPPSAHVELEVSLLPSGEAVDINTRTPSGSPEMDMALRRAVLAATPIELPADPAGYERLRRFTVIYDAKAGLGVVEAPPAAGAAPQPRARAPEPFLCSAASLPRPQAPNCRNSGSRNELLSCYAQAVQKRVVMLVSACGSTVYPLEARRNHWEGTAQVAVTFERSGKLSGVALQESSGQGTLDQRALELVREGLVPPPAELYATPFAVQVPVVFRMQQRTEAQGTLRKEM